MGAKKVSVVLRTVGDDQRSPADVVSARLQSGARVPLSGPGVLGPLKLPKGGELSLEIQLREPLRVSMEVSVLEAEQ